MNAVDIMTRNVITVDPAMDVRRVAALFIEHNISGAPVVDSTGTYRGIVLEEGLIVQDKKIHLPTFFFFLSGFFTLGERQFEDELKKLAATTVAGIMEENAPTITPATPVEDIATMMIEKNRHYLPVIDGSRLVGVVTKKDIVRAIAKGIL